MKYCSECGAQVRLQRVAQEEHHRHVCAGCGSIHYTNPRIIVCCSVRWENRVLMCRRSQQPGLGMWTVPSGFLECGETLEAGAARETLEETGLCITPQQLELQAVINMVEIEQVAIAFRTEIGDPPPLRPGPECSEVAFLTEDELPPAQLAWHGYLGQAAREWFRQMRSRDFSIYLATLGSWRDPRFKSREYKLR